MDERFNSKYQSRYITIAELVGPFHDMEINTFISTADYISNILRESRPILLILKAGIAQSVEQLICNQ